MWIGEAADVIAEAISKAEDKEVSSHKVREALMKDGNAENVAWLEEVATSPSINQKLFSSAVARVNEKNKALVNALPVRQREYWILAFVWWVGGTVLLFGVGWTLRWVYRGFRENAA